eukprot:UN15118
MGRTHRFQVGIGNAIKAWDDAILRMVEGEKALVECSAKYGFGEKVPKIRCSLK